MLYLQLAWRNLWRNKRRTLITTASIFFAVLIALVTRSMQLGSYASMIDNVVRLSTGHIQLHALGYWENKSIDRSFTEDSALCNSLLRIPHVTLVVPRLETFLLAAAGQSTRVVRVVGIDPDEERRMNGLDARVTAGQYLTDGDPTALVAAGLARTLDLGIGDTLILYGVGYHGTTAAATFRIGGLATFPTPPMNQSLVFLTLSSAQDLLQMPSQLNSLSILIDDPREQAEVVTRVRTSWGGTYEILTWQEMMPEVVQGIEVDNAGGVIMILILYVVIGFGMFGTTMMMTLERRREFGILLAVGMHRTRLTLVTLMESLCLSLLGITLGTVAGLPLLLYLYYHPIHLYGDAAAAMLEFGFEPVVPFSLDPAIFWSQGYIILLLAAISAAYPALVVHRLDPVAAMRS